MNIDNIFRVDTINNDDHIMQKATFLSVFQFGVFYSQKNGSHFSLSFGIGPAEIEWSFRLWLTETR